MSHESILQWVFVFGPAIARGLRVRRPKPHSRWHLDEVFVRIGGRQIFLWRAVDAEGEVLEVLVQSERDARAARKLMRKLLKRHRSMPEVRVTDRCRCYGAALRDLSLRIVAHHQHKRANNRAGGLHVPIRRRERKHQDFKSPRSVQRFLWMHAATYNTFTVLRHLFLTSTHRLFRAEAFEA